MTLLRLSLALAALSSLVGCGFVSDVRIDGPYRVVAVDESAKKTLCRTLVESGDCIGLVDAAVVAVGFNQTYLVAARLPFDDTDPFDGKPDGPDRPIQYFYVVRSPAGSVNDVVKGPFDETAYKAERDRLNLPRLMPIPD